MPKQSQGSYLIGVAGGSASGKTTFLERLKNLFPGNELAVISQDHYYKGLSEQVKDQNGRINFDLPEGVDFSRLIKDIRKLRKGIMVEMVEYTFNNPKKFPRQITISPAPVIVIEGNFIYTHLPLFRLFDLKLFIEARQDIMFERRLARDINERGMTRDQIEYQWYQHVVPSFERHLLPFRDEADMVIVNNNDLDISTSVIADHIRTQL